MPPLVGWSLLSASGAGVAAGVVLDLSCQLAWNTMMIARTVQQHRKRAEAGASARAAIGVTFGPTLAAAGFAAVTVLARYSYEKYYAAPTLSPLADFADARSVWALERRVDEQQRAARQGGVDERVRGRPQLLVDWEGEDEEQAEGGTHGHGDGPRAHERALCTQLGSRERHGAPKVQPDEGGHYRHQTRHGPLGVKRRPANHGLQSRVFVPALAGRAR